MQIVAPALRDRITKEHHSLLILFNSFGPCTTSFVPQTFEPVIAANRTSTGKTIVVGRQFNVRQVFRSER